MNIHSIEVELNLRHWLRDAAALWNTNNVDQVGIEWIEPAFGSSPGIPDCRIVFKKKSVEIELKHLNMKKRGIEWKIRPLQRRYHVMGAKEGKRTAILSTVNYCGRNNLILIRGDRVPLRDYEDIEDSGGKVNYQIIEGDNEMERFRMFMRYILMETYWL